LFLENSPMPTKRGAIFGATPIMPTVLLKFPASLTPDQARHAWTEGQNHFWVASEKEDGSYTFHAIGKHPATYALRAMVDLKFGNYILGCGFGRNKLRKRFRVDLIGVHWL
jgi:hypothetical protein